MTVNHRSARPPSDLHHRLRAPFVTWLQWYNRDSAGLRQTTQALQALLMKQPDWRQAAPDTFAAKRHEEIVGFEILSHLHNIAFESQGFAEAQANAEPVMARMAGALGEDNRFVHAARIHHRDIVFRTRAPSSTPLGVWHPPP